MSKNTDRSECLSNKSVHTDESNREKMSVSDGVVLYSVEQNINKITEMLDMLESLKIRGKPVETNIALVRQIKLRIDDIRKGVVKA